ncbi:hypothetical protein [Sphingomonas mollis]|uniref:Uncharacterized protein n=1 Tax=Sphingomonas mollis TaxID=2795726 RepID=A0ABS0XTF8_9SPHN|nr:hypothetical protein [Sphingomonas sp. BT553]MBJ6123308.1 hypothetical protein [Sphingomonas sp. BT553]
MSHSPTVPAGNQSPYPIAEPPHAKSAAPAADASSGKDDGTVSSTVTDIVARLPSVEPRTAYIGAIAVVAAGVVGGLFYALTGRKKAPAKPAPKSSPRSAPKSPPKPRRAKAATGTRRKASDAK